MAVLASVPCAAIVILWLWSYVEGEVYRKPSLTFHSEDGRALDISPSGAELRVYGERQTLIARFQCFTVESSDGSVFFSAARGEFTWGPGDPRREMRSYIAALLSNGNDIHGERISREFPEDFQEVKPAPPKHVQFLGLSYIKIDGRLWVPPYSFLERRIIVPYWFLFALAAPLPLWHWSRWIRRERREKRGLCWRCAYDLRASQDRCPECGTPIPPAPGDIAEAHCPG